MQLLRRDADDAAVSIRAGRPGVDVLRAACLRFGEPATVDRYAARSAAVCAVIGWAGIRFGGACRLCGDDDDFTGLSTSTGGAYTVGIVSRGWVQGLAGMPAITGRSGPDTSPASRSTPASPASRSVFTRRRAASEVRPTCSRTGSVSSPTARAGLRSLPVDSVTPLSHRRAAWDGSVSGDDAEGGGFRKNVQTTPTDRSVVSSVPARNRCRSGPTASGRVGISDYHFGKVRDARRRRVSNVAASSGAGIARVRPLICAAWSPH